MFKIMVRILTLNSLNVLFSCKYIYGGLRMEKKKCRRIDRNRTECAMFDFTELKRLQTYTGMLVSDPCL